jgi:hypothetical protein
MNCKKPAPRHAYATLSSAPEIHSSPFRAPERLVLALLPVTVFLATGCGNPKAAPRFRIPRWKFQRASETQKEIPSGAPAFDLVLAGPDRPIPTKALFCSPIAGWTQRQAALRSFAHFALVSLEDCGRRQKWKQWNATSRRVPASSGEQRKPFVVRESEMQRAREIADEFYPQNRNRRSKVARAFNHLGMQNCAQRSAN